MSDKPPDELGVDLHAAELHGRIVGEIDYNPFDYEIDARVHDVWRRMRDEAPLYRNEQRFSSVRGTTLDLMRPDFDLRLMIFMDPPEHSWHRRRASIQADTVVAVRPSITSSRRALWPSPPTSTIEVHHCL
jgi:hypothetical protein